MSGVNKVIIIGNLGRDPEMRSTQSGNPVCNLNVATSRKWMNKQTNEWQDETEWHRVTVFGKSGEACGKYLGKGSKVYVDGRIQTRSYDDKDGNKRYATEVIANDVQFLDRRNDSGGGGQGGGNGQSGGGGAYGNGGYQNNGGQGGNQGGGAPPPYDPGKYAPTGPEDDDIPF